MKLNKLMIFTLILFIFPFVNASNDFSAVMFSGGSQMCTCTSIEDIITINNNQPMPIAYTLSLSGNFENFYTLSEDFIVISPFETKEIRGFINPKCGFYGSGNVEITIEPNIGEERTINRNLNILNCENNRLEYRVANHFINNPCTETIYPLTITNIGDYPEIYDFSVEGLNSRYVSFSHNSVFLQPGESLDFHAYILKPCEYFGNYTGNFVSTAQNSNLVSKVPFKLTLERLYNFSVSLGYYENQNPIYMDELNYEYCAGLKYQIPVKVSNDVFISNAYNIKLKGDYWFTSDAKRIELHGESFGIFNLTATPNKEVIGDHIFPLEINSMRGDLTVNPDININVIDCSSFNILLDYDPISCCGTNTYYLTIENQAHTPNEISIETNAIISNNTFILQPNETKSIEMKFDLSCYEENEFYINASNFIESKEIIVPFETYSVEECQKLVLDSRQREIVFYDWKKIPLVFKNIGIRGSNYNVSIEGPEWITIDSETFYLNPQEKELINLYSNASNYTQKGTYYVNIIHFSDNGYGHFNQIEIELKEWNLKDATYLFIRNNKGIAILLFLILIVLIILLIYFIKDFKRKQKTKPKKEIKETKQSKKSSKKRNYKKFFGWILLLLLLIGLTIYFLYYFESKEDKEKEINETIIYNETINETINESLIIKPDVEDINISPEEEKHQYLVENNLLDSFLYHSWYKNEVLKLDLDNNFEDPDGEPLTYTSSIPQNIEVFIDGPIVYLTPKQNWTGIEKIFFRATDTAGDYVISPEVTLIVREKTEKEIEEKSMFENIFNNLGIYTQLYLFYVIIGVILLLIILLVLSRNNDNKKKKN